MILLNLRKIAGDDVKKNIEQRLNVAVARGVAWLVSRQLPDGEFEGCGKDLAGYYKSLLAFEICGRLDAGGRCLSYVRDNFVHEDGTLSSGLEKTSLTRMQRNLANYMDGWVAIGAWQLGDLQLAERIVTQLVHHQCESHGGIETGPARWALRQRYDLATAASCGRAFLMTGHRSPALDAAEFLAKALEHQRDPEHGLDLCFDAEWHPLDAEDPSEMTYYRFDLSKRGEKVWFPAFSCAFLCEVFGVSKNHAHLDAARRYFEYVTNTPEFKERSLANGKSGWAAGLLGGITGEVGYCDALSWIVDNVLTRQRSDGEFGPAPRSQVMGEDRDRAPIPRRLERTSEFTTWSAVFQRMHSMGIFAP